MTRERAVELLKGIQFCCDFDDCTNAWDCEECVDAFRMAIEALEQESIKFYYVESIDDYWIGQRLDNFYYAKWNSKLGFVWSASRYLPWGEHIVNENTLWKEHTYPSEPKETPFIEWIIGFTKKYFKQEPKRGKWVDKGDFYICSECGKRMTYAALGSECSRAYAFMSDYCPHCGARMESDEE